MRLRVLHTTRYEYPTPAIDSHNEARLEPLSDEDQTCLDFTIKTSPSAKMYRFELPTGGVHHFGIRLPHRSLTITANSLVETKVACPIVSLPSDSPLDLFGSSPELKQEFAEYLSWTKRVLFFPEIAQIALKVERTTGGGVVEFVQELNRKLYRDFAYSPGTTDVNTPLLEVLESKMGVCQDFAHLMLAVCRYRGIPARYVSGYLYTGQKENLFESESEEEYSECGEDELHQGLVSGDAMHAWVECLLPDRRWHGLDPTNNVLTDHRYVKVHLGRDYGDVPPLRGVFRGPASQKLEVSVRVIKELE